MTALLAAPAVDRAIEDLQGWLDAHPHLHDTAAYERVQIRLTAARAQLPS